MLGINDPWMRIPKPSRDYYCANPGDPKIAALVAAGAIRLYRVSDSYEWFCCTDAGRAAAMASHKTIRKSKSARVYSKFLEISDCLPDMTFRDFLTRQDMADYRKSA